MTLRTWHDSLEFCRVSRNLLSFWLWVLTIGWLMAWTSARWILAALEQSFFCALHEVDPTFLQSFSNWDS